MTPETETRSDVPVGRALVGTAIVSTVILACGIVTGLIAARSLGPTGRGELAIIVVWASTLLYAGSLGLPHAVAYFAAARPASADRVWTTGQAGAVVVGFLVTVAGWWLIPAVLSDQSTSLRESARWYLLLFVVPGLGSLCATYWLQGIGNLKALNWARVTPQVVAALGFVLLLSTDDTSVRDFALILLVGNAAGWLVAAAFGSFTRIAKALPSQHLTKEMLWYGMRVQIGSWANTASVRLDQLLLSVFAAAASLGLYVVAVNYASVVLIVPGSAALVMLPQMIQQHRDGKARVCLERWYRRLFWTTLLGGGAIALAASVIVPVAFGSAFHEAVPLVAILTPATIILGMNEILSTAFRGIDRPEIASKSELVGVVVSVAALVVLLPRYGVYGAAIASLLAYGSIHMYMTRQAMIVFETNFKSLYIPTREDAAALRDAAMRTYRRLKRGRSVSSVSTQEL